ncbi:MAG TPA: hypothetical protein VGO59_10745 [Verrucomicrobiae bacterium]
MSPKLKLIAYCALLILCAWFAIGFYVNYSAVTETPSGGNAASLPAKKHRHSATNAVAGTNAPANAANSAATNETTNAVVSDTNAAAVPATNITSIVDSNIPPPPATNVPAPAVQVAGGAALSPEDSARRSTMIAYLAALVGAIVGLGLLIASDVSQLVGTRAVDFLFNDAGEGQRDPEYERAEAEWANGKHLDAIQMMRDYLKKHPREIYAALRIAEIYEKDLRNYLAAALEYEEILKQRLPAERWGWAAIHLCNLYSRINQGDKTLALLHRIADEYPKTGAAKKARARLGIAEPELEQGAAEAIPEAEANDLSGEQPVITMEERPPELEPRKASPTPPPPAQPAESPKPNLPPGFRPKK